MQSTQAARFDAISLRPKEEALHAPPDVFRREVFLQSESFDRLGSSLRLITHKPGLGSLSMLADGWHTLPAAELAAGSFKLFASLQSHLEAMCVAGS